MNKETAFSLWAKSVKARIQGIPPGTFKESGTLISGIIIIINKEKTRK